MLNLIVNTQASLADEEVRRNRPLYVESWFTAGEMRGCSGGGSVGVGVTKRAGL